jgi:hypothetical protein
LLAAAAASAAGGGGDGGGGGGAAARTWVVTRLVRTPRLMPQQPQLWWKCTSTGVMRCRYKGQTLIIITTRASSGFQNCTGCA